MGLFQKEGRQRDRGWHLMVIWSMCVILMWIRKFKRDEVRET